MDMPRGTALGENETPVHRRPYERFRDDAPDPEMLGVPLELERPELRPILDRYISRGRAPHSTSPGGDRDVALVAFPSPQQGDLAAAFAACGWRVHECAGPPAEFCSLTTSGRRCELRAAVDVAVVAIGGDVNLSNGGVALTSCAGCPASPGVVVLLGHNADQIEVEERTAIVGTGSTPQQVVAVAEYMLPFDESSHKPLSNLNYEQ